MEIDGTNADDDQKGPENIDAITEPFGVRSEEKDHYRWHQKEEDVGHLNRRNTSPVQHSSSTSQEGEERKRKREGPTRPLS